jgi:putative membrane protein insertion efficiency factor
MIKGILKKKMVLISLAVFVMAAMNIPTCGAADKNFSPWDFNQTGIKERKNASAESSSSAGGALLIGAVRFYQRHLSPVLGNQCPMYPSCSAYSIEAIKKHGFFMGTMMMTDRLIRESTEMELSPMIKVHDEFRYYDPVTNNDFWWAYRK